MNTNDGLSDEALAEVRNAWARQAVTLRLSQERKAKLFELLGDRAGELAPTAAIDLALDLAIAALQLGPQPKAEPMPSLQEGASEMRRFAEMMVNEAIDGAEAMRRLRHDMADLRGLIHAVMSCEPPEAKDDTPTHPSIRDWLDQEAADLPSRSFLARARIQQSEAQPGHMVLFVERVAAAQVRGPKARGLPALATLPASSELAKLVAGVPEHGDFYLMCKGTDHGWQASLHPLSDGGQPGSATGSAMT